MQATGTYSSPQEILKTYWGYDHFRPQQLEVIETVLAGKDVLTLLPTGAGKSICYQIPVLCKKGIGIVISPLIALMQDQVKDLKAKNINAINLGGEIDFYTQQRIFKDIQAGIYQFIYCSPEKLAQKNFQDFLQSIPIQLIAIDEAHCISEWGHDFRPEYRRINEIIEEIPQDFPIIALTATATPKVQSDIVKTLQLRKPDIYISSFNRPNLYYEIRPKKSPQLAIKNMVQFIKQRHGKSGIVYVINRKTADDVADILRANGIKEPLTTPV